MSRDVSIESIDTSLLSVTYEVSEWMPRLSVGGCPQASQHPATTRGDLISGNGETSSRLPPFSLFLPGSCPNNRDRRKPSEPITLVTKPLCARFHKPLCPKSFQNSVHHYF